MREVTRLPDRVKIKWELLNNAGRRVAVNWVDSSLSDLRWGAGDPDWREVTRRTPAPDARGTWNLVCLVKDAATFNTPTKELTPGDVAIDVNEVIWKEADDHYQRERVGDVTIVRSGATIERIERISR